MVYYLSAINPSSSNCELLWAHVRGRGQIVQKDLVTWFHVSPRKHASVHASCLLSCDTGELTIGWGLEIHQIGEKRGGGVKKRAREWSLQVGLAMYRGVDELSISRADISASCKVVIVIVTFSARRCWFKIKAIIFSLQHRLALTDFALWFCFFFFFFFLGPWKAAFSANLDRSTKVGLRFWFLWLALQKASSDA